MKLIAAAASDVGRQRADNQDAFLLSEDLALFAVADGMGGHRGGEVASATAVEALRAAVAGGRPIDAAIRVANDAVLERAATDDSLTGMGTTLTAALAVGGHTLLIGHVGDSRAYLLREGTLRRLTEDHSLVEELVREGRLTPEQAEVHPQRAIVTRALGVELDVDVDLYTVDVHTGDRVVVCSDGLTTMLRDREIEQLARDETDPRLAADQLVDAANDAGGEDNITVLVLDILEVDDAAPPDPIALAHAVDVPLDGPGTAAAPPVEAPEPPRARSSRPPIGRTLGHVALFLVPILVVAAVAVGSIGWYARRTYYVGLDSDEVVLYKGRPGGLLGWDPTVEQRTDMFLGDLDEVDQAALADGAAVGSRDRAERYLAKLEQSALPTLVTTSTSTTTSTVPTTTLPEAPSTPAPAPPST